MSLKKIALALSLGIVVMHPIKSAFGLCNPESAFGTAATKSMERTESCAAVIV
jgi:hypothetical protein